MAREAQCSIHQPNLFPRLSTLAKLFASDVWVALDDVQFARHDYQQRCRLATIGDIGSQQWLTVPVHLPDGRATVINKVQLADPVQAQRRLTGLLRQYYGRSPHWAAFTNSLDEVLAVLSNTDRLAELSEISTLVLLSLVGWPGRAQRSSELPARAGRSERLADLTRACGASTYICGTGGARYLDQQPFAQRGLGVAFFTAPSHADSGIWQGAGRVTALWALMTIGPAALGRALREQATRAGGYRQPG